MARSCNGVSWLAVAGTVAITIGACAVVASVMVASGAIALWVLAAGGCISLLLGLVGVWMVRPAT